MQDLVTVRCISVMLSLGGGQIGCGGGSSGPITGHRRKPLRSPLPVEGPFSGLHLSLNLVAYLGLLHPLI